MRKWVQLHAQNISVFLLRCLHGEVKMNIPPVNTQIDAFFTATPVQHHPLNHLLERVSVAVFAHLQKPVDILSECLKVGVSPPDEKCGL